VQQNHESRFNEDETRDKQCRDNSKRVRQNHESRFNEDETRDKQCRDGVSVWTGNGNDPDGSDDPLNSIHSNLDAEISLDSTN
jgi:hypothetical protein